MNVVAVGFVVLGAGFDGDDFADLAEKGTVEGSGVADGLREERRVAGAGDAVEALVPPVVGGDVEAGDAGGGVDELR